MLSEFAPGSVVGPDMMGNRGPSLCYVAYIDSGQSNLDMGSLEMCESSRDQRGQKSQTKDCPACLKSRKSYDPKLLVDLLRKMKNLFLKIRESQIFALKEILLSEFD